MMNSIEYWLKFDLMSYNKTVNDFQFRWIQGLINPWNMIFPWVDQSLYSPHGVINCMLFYKRIRKQNFLLYMFFSSILIRQERNTICVCFIWIYKCISYFGNLTHFWHDTVWYSFTGCNLTCEIRKILDRRKDRFGTNTESNNVSYRCDSDRDSTVFHGFPNPCFYVVIGGGGC